MQIANKIQKQNITFSKWSRKGFAVFASLGKVVKIAQLKVEICKQAIKKNINLLDDLFILKKDNFIAQTNEIVEILLQDLFIENNLLIQSLNTKTGRFHKKLQNEYNQSPCFAPAFHGLFNFIDHDKHN